MIADETFPVELLFDEPYVCNTNGDFRGTSGGGFDSSGLSSENLTMTTTTEGSSASKSFANQENFEDTYQDNNFSLSDASDSRQALITKVPLKKKSFSCQNLMTKKNYDHVESKVKKIIQTMNDEDRRRKQLARHKSMPLSPQPPFDDIFAQEKDPVVLLKELRRRTARVFDLEEKNEFKDDTIYALEIERSKMKMTFDSLRTELHELKNKEKQFNLLLAASPPRRKVVRNVLTQTDDSLMPFPHNLPTINLADYSEGSLRIINLSNPLDMGNTSSEPLLPLADISLEDLNSTQGSELNITPIIENPIDVPEATEKRKKPKKLKGFFKLMSCVSKQK